MAEERVKADWMHTSNLLAMTAETNRNPKKRSRPYTAADFPLRRKKERPARAVTIDRLERDMMRIADQVKHGPKRKPPRGPKASGPTPTSE